MSGQGKMLAGISNDSFCGNVVLHAVARFRERWPQGGHLTDDEVRRLISEQVQKNLKRGNYEDRPGGRYVPFSFFGEDGFAVVTADGNTTTVVFEDWYPEVSAKLRRKRAEV